MQIGTAITFATTDLGVTEPVDCLTKKTFLLSACMERLIEGIRLSAPRERQNRVVLSQQDLTLAPHSRLIVR